MEWFKDGEQLTDEGRVVIVDEVDESDPELFSLVVEGCLVQDAGEYKCVAMNEAGRAESVCTLIVDAKALPAELTELLHEEMDEVGSPSGFFLPFLDLFTPKLEKYIKSISQHFKRNVEVT